MIAYMGDPRVQVLESPCGIRGAGGIRNAFGAVSIIGSENLGAGQDLEASQLWDDGFHRLRGRAIGPSGRSLFPRLPIDPGHGDGSGPTPGHGAASLPKASPTAASRIDAPLARSHHDNDLLESSCPSEKPGRAYT